MLYPAPPQPHQQPTHSARRQPPVLPLPPSGQVQAYILRRAVCLVFCTSNAQPSQHTAEMVQPGPTGLVKGLPFGITLNIKTRERRQKGACKGRAPTGLRALGEGLATHFCLIQVEKPGLTGAQTHVSSSIS